MHDRRAPLVLLLAILLATAVAAPVRAQSGDAEPSAPVPPALASPKATLETFVNAMAVDPPDLERARRCLDASEIARDAVDDVAVKLYRCLNRIEWVDFESDPSIPEAAAAEADGLTTWRFFPRPDAGGAALQPRDWMDVQARQREVRRLAPAARIDLVRGEDGAWRFGPATVAGVESLWDALRDLEPLGGVAAVTAAAERRTVSERIESWFPATMRERSVLGVRLWQWSALAAIVFIGLLLDLVIRLLLSVVARRTVRRRGGDVQEKTIRRSVRPFGMAAAGVAWIFLVRLIGLPSTALLFLGPALRLYAMLATVWAGFRVTDLVGEYFAERAARTEHRFDDLVVPLLRKTAKIIIGVFGLIYIAASNDVEIGPLLTGLGIGGVGFAFAAKDTLENLFGSVTVILDRPFQVGDWVVIGETEGTVEELGLRSVRIRTFYNSLVTLPTANLVRARVDNYGARKYRRWTTHVNLCYETPPDLVEAFCEGVRELIRQHPFTRKDYYQCWLHKFGPHSIDVLIYMFFEAPDWTVELRERQRLMLDVMRLAERLGIGFAYPTQTLKLERGAPYDPEAIAAGHETPDGGDEIRAIREGRVAAREMLAEARWKERQPGLFNYGPGDDELDPDADPPETQVESRVGGDAG